jgi:hypothetical protein
MKLSDEAMILRWLSGCYFSSEIDERLSLLCDDLKSTVMSAYSYGIAAGQDQEQSASCQSKEVAGIETMFHGVLVDSIDGEVERARPETSNRITKIVY